MPELVMASIHGLPYMPADIPSKDDQGSPPLACPSASRVFLFLCGTFLTQVGVMGPHVSHFPLQVMPHHLALSSLKLVSFCHESWHTRRRRRSGWSGGRGHVGPLKRSSANACMTSFCISSPTPSGSQIPSPASARSTWGGNT